MINQFSLLTPQLDPVVWLWLGYAQYIGGFRSHGHPEPTIRLSIYFSTCMMHLPFLYFVFSLT
jgi:hypothetical protein